MTTTPPPSSLVHGLTGAAAIGPERIAIEDPGMARRINYHDLAVLTDRVRDRLVHAGVERGDRVGLHLTKSIDAVAVIYGILKAGAVYVPVDATAPPTRNAYIFSDCTVRAVVVEQNAATRLRKAMAELDAKTNPCLIELPVTEGDRLPITAALDALDAKDSSPAATSVEPDPDDLAYILYTSGSTGHPKGVMLSHRNATSFIDWCTDTFQPTKEDRFASHAPFHFDLSILDIHTSLRHGATLVLFGQNVGKEPARLASGMAESRLTIWYSAPSILSLLTQYGDLESHDFSTLRMVLFAGEVFPIKHLRTLKKLIPHPRYFNLYGPTETNVCTFHEIPATIPDDRTDPYPIGRSCSHLSTCVVEGTTPVDAGKEGELCVAGKGVMQAYWNLGEQTERVFFTDDQGVRWYRTGDIVCEDHAGAYLFRGRRDRMVKKRGYRIELGEIEASLYRHPNVREAAVIADADDAGLHIKAFIHMADGGKPSLIAFKRHCSEQLPLYMVPDKFIFGGALPKTSTDKIDYQQLSGTKQPKGHHRTTNQNHGFQLDQ